MVIIFLRNESDFYRLYVYYRITDFFLLCYLYIIIFERKKRFNYTSKIIYMIIIIISTF